MRFENGEIRVIKRESKMMVDKRRERERERERERDNTCYNHEPSSQGEQSYYDCKVEEGKATSAVEDNSLSHYFFWNHFLEKKN